MFVIEEIRRCKFKNLQTYLLNLRSRSSQIFHVPICLLSLCCIFFHSILTPQVSQSNGKYWVGRRESGDRNWNHVFILWCGNNIDLTEEKLQLSRLLLTQCKAKQPDTQRKDTSRHFPEEESQRAMTSKQYLLLLVTWDTLKPEGAARPCLPWRKSNTNSDAGEDLESQDPVR